MGIETIIGGAIGLGSAFLSNRNRNRAIRDATNAQVGASDRQLDLFERIYNEQVGRNEPFRQSELYRSGLIDEIYGRRPEASPVRQPGGGNAFNAFTERVRDINPNLYPRDRYSAEIARPFSRAMPQEGQDRQINAFNIQSDKYGPQVQPGVGDPARPFQIRNINELPVNGGWNPPQGTGVDQTVGDPLAGMDPQDRAMQRFWDSPFGRVYTENFQRDRDAIDSSLANSGLVFSGARMSAIEDSRARNFGNAFSQYFSGLFGQPSMAATGANNAAGSAFAANSAQSIGNIGAAQAEGAYGRGESRNAFLGDILNTGGWVAGRTGIFG